MRELVESILTGNNVEAHRLFESRLNDIREKKLYEAKRNLAAQMNEVLGGLTKAEIEARKKAGYRKASDVLSDPRENKNKKPLLNPKAKIVKRKIGENTIDEMRAPGEIPGSAERQMDAMKVRAIRAAYGPDKTGASHFRTAYLAKRKAQMKSDDKQTPRDISSLRDMAWSKSEKSKGPYLKRIEASKQKASQQKRVDKIAGQAIKNLAGGKDIGKNIGRIAKYGKQSSAIKSIKGGHDVWMGKKDPTTLKGHGIALVRDIFKG